MGDYNDLIIYQKGYKLAMDIFEVTKRFPAEEKFSLTDQIRGLHGLFVLTLLSHIVDDDTRLFSF